MNIKEAVETACKEPALLGALSWICLWESERIVKQAKENKIVNIDTGARWETCFEHCIKLVMESYPTVDLLPTEKVCPECEGSGTKNILENNKPTGWFEGCDKCHSIGTIPAYYTPAQYEKIMGKPYPEDALVWIAPTLSLSKWTETTYRNRYRYYYNQEASILIVQTAQSAPPADYRPEE